MEKHIKGIDNQFEVGANTEDFDFQLYCETSIKTMRTYQHLEEVTAAIDLVGPFSDFEVHIAVRRKRHEPR